MAGFANSTHRRHVFYEYLAKCYQTRQWQLVCAEAHEVNSAGVDRRKFHIVAWARCVIEIAVTRIDSVVPKVIHDH